MIEPLRAANEIADEDAFGWSLISETQNQVLSSAKVGFEPDAQLADVTGLDYLVLLSAPTGDFANPAAAQGILRRLERYGTILGAISGGVFPLVRSGVTHNAAISVHWCYEAAFRSEFPHILASTQVIEKDGRCYTASGAAAAFDLSLSLIENRLGRGVATEVACWFQHPMMRGANVQQSTPIVGGDSTDAALSPFVAQVIALFADDMENPITIAQVSQKMGVTPRHIERQFKKVTDQGPNHYYRMMRMKAARQMVMYSNDDISQIAHAVGYGSAAVLNKYYIAAFGISPKEDRKRINLYRVEQNISVPSR